MWSRALALLEGDRVLRTPDDPAGGEHQQPAYDDLQGGRPPRRVHVTMPNPADRAELGDHDDDGEHERQREIGEEERHGVAEAPRRRHQPAHEAADPWMSAP